MKTKTLLFILPFLVLSFSELYAQGGYIGGGAGNAFRNHKLTDINGESFSLDKNSFTWKIFAGARWKFLGLEGGYVDFGTVEETTRDSSGNVNNYKDNTKGGFLFATGTLNISVIRLFAKAGGFFQNTTTSVNSIEDTIKGAKFAWGLGAGVQFGVIGVNLQYEGFQINPDNLSLLSLNLILGLGDI